MKSKNGGIKKFFLWLVALVSGFPLNTHRRSEPVVKRAGESTTADYLITRRRAMEAVTVNLNLMDEAVARYMALLAQPENRHGFEAATVLRKSYLKARKSFVPINGNSLSGQMANAVALVHDIFHEISLMIGAADMSELLGATDFGAGFEHLTIMYQPGANMYQPVELKLDDEIYADFLDAAAHFDEVKAELQYRLMPKLQ